MNPTLAYIIGLAAQSGAFEPSTRAVPAGLMPVKPNDRDVAARIREERLQRKAAEFAKRQPKPKEPPCPPSTSPSSDAPTA